LGQLAEALVFDCSHGVLVTMLHVAKRLRKRVFQRRGLKLIGIDAKARIHRYDADGWRLLFKNI
jgi:hypothetical protein